MCAHNSISYYSVSFSPRPKSFIHSHKISNDSIVCWLLVLYEFYSARKYEQQFAMKMELLRSLPSHFFDLPKLFTNVLFLFFRFCMCCSYWCCLYEHSRLALDDSFSILKTSVRHTSELWLCESYNSLLFSESSHHIK